jgi:urate oxidase / 2-oxo-4-hydroxy-4-carboxy-5-ureidoimidazoline decarboxylase
MAQPVGHSYGKAAVGVHRAEGDRLFSCEVRMIARGQALESSYTEGDNSLVVATDSMKNFIQREALRFTGESVEDFLVQLGERFLALYGHVEALELRAREDTFARRVGAVLQRLYDDRGVVEMWLYRDSDRLERSGLQGLHLVKLSGSSFAGFLRDEYTTLPDAWDRPLFVHLDVTWHNADYGQRASREEVRELLIATFADFNSASIQQLVHEMGVRALDRFSELDNISFRAENRLWDLVEDAEGVAIYTDARPPFGEIFLSLER